MNALDNDETNPPVALGASSSASPALLSPFPIVRLRGRILRRSVRVSLLSVRAPARSRITIMCRGRGRSCPRTKTTLTTKKTQTVRFRAFQRSMRSGTLLRIFVTKPNSIGKYTRFRIRYRKPPLRADMCARPNITAFRCR